MSTHRCPGCGFIGTRKEVGDHMKQCIEKTWSYSFDQKEIDMIKESLEHVIENPFNDDLDMGKYEELLKKMSQH